MMISFFTSVKDPAVNTAFRGFLQNETRSGWNNVPNDTAKTTTSLRVLDNPLASKR